MWPIPKRHADFFPTDQLSFSPPGFDPATQAEPENPSYFELPLTESDPLRVTQSNGLNDYIRHLQQDDSRLRSILHPNYTSTDAFVRSTTTYRQAFQESIGYPPPGAISNAEAEFTLIGEDDIGIYFRVLIPTLPNVQTQGIYILPKVRTGPVPLILALHGGGGSPEKALAETITIGCAGPSNAVTPYIRPADAIPFRGPAPGDSVDDRSSITIGRHQHHSRRNFQTPP